MSVATPFEKRREKRVNCGDRGFFQVDGDEQVLLKFRDVSDRGVGAYTRVMFSKGAVGSLSARLNGEAESKRRHFEVMWCAPTDDESHKLYPYRVGLRMTGEEVEIPRPEPAGASRADKPARQAPKAVTPPPNTEKEDQSNYRVKGSMLLDIAKMIRRHHDKPWQNFVTFDDTGGEQASRCGIGPQIVHIRARQLLRVLGTVGVFVRFLAVVATREWSENTQPRL